MSPFSKMPGYMWMVKCDSKMLRVGADFLKYRGKTQTPFSKIPGYAWTRPQVLY